MLAALLFAFAAQANSPDVLLSTHRAADHAAAQSELLDHADAAALEALLDHADWRIRQEAAAALTWLEDPEAAALAWSLQPERTRSGLPRFLGGDHRSEQMTPILIERLLHGSEDAWVRVALIDAIHRSGGPWSDALAGSIADEADPEVRAAMVTAMRYADPEAALAGLALGLRDGDAAVRADAARTAGWRPEAVALSADLAALLRDADADARGFAARSLGWLGAEGAFEAIAPLLDDGDADVRLHALRALERLDADRLRGEAALSGLTGDSDARVARAAAGLLGD